MDRDRFDQITRVLANAPTRRTFVGVALGVLGSERATAKKKK